jgi:hypothetical protein
MKTKLKNKLSLEQKLELEDRTIEALLLGFRKPIWRDYSIPSPSKIQEATGYAIRKLCGIDGNKFLGTYFNEEGIGWYYLANPEKIQPRVRKGLQDIFSGCKDEMNSLDRYMVTIENPHLQHEWVCLKGDIYKFKQGERKKAQERVNSYWKKPELDNFKTLHHLMNKYISDYYEKLKRGE